MQNYCFTKKEKLTSNVLNYTCSVCLFLSLLLFLSNIFLFEYKLKMKSSFAHNSQGLVEQKEFNAEFASEILKMKKTTTPNTFTCARKQDDLRAPYSSIDGRGRLGNQILAVKQLLRIGMLYGCDLMLPTQLYGVEGFSSPYSYLINSSKYPSPDLCKKVAIGELIRSSIGAQEDIYNSSFPPVVSGSFDTQEMKKVIGNILDMYLGRNKTHSLGKKCDKQSVPSISLHVRSGDIASGKFNEEDQYIPSSKVHRKYVPFPTSYYLSALARVRTQLGSSKFESAEISVFCEDFSNPSCHALKMLSTLLKNIKIFTETSLHHDLWKLSCSDIVVVSRGSFKFAYLSPNLHWEHIFIDNFSASGHKTLERKTRKTLYYINNNSSADKYKNMIYGWRNTVRQRHIISQAFDIKWYDYA